MGQSVRISTAQELAKRFKVCDRTVYRWRDSGKLEGFMAGGQWRFEEMKVKRFMAMRRKANKKNKRTP